MSAFKAAAACAVLLAVIALDAPGGALAQFGGADVPPEVAVRWSALDPKKWNVRSRRNVFFCACACRFGGGVGCRARAGA